MNRCATCVYWEPKRGVAEGSATQPGFCHQRPPVPVAFAGPDDGRVEFRTLWPIVEAVSWCGRHRMRRAEREALPGDATIPALPVASESGSVPSSHAGGAGPRLNGEAA